MKRNKNFLEKSIIKKINPQVKTILVNNKVYYFYRMICDKNSTKTQLKNEILSLFDLEKESILKLNTFNIRAKKKYNKFGLSIVRKANKIVILKMIQPIDLLSLVSKYAGINLDNTSINSQLDTMKENQNHDKIGSDL